ncbi:hypothetical protein [Dactylosporangium sp. CA-139066]|uniref:hypothetical protein n=1 Tax=Dactylosporangium sp. CA-139066 TaxID=3239930 RepID=UPI003D8FCB76
MRRTDRRTLLLGLAAGGIARTGPGRAQARDAVAYAALRVVRENPGPPEITLPPGTA